LWYLADKRVGFAFYPSFP